MGIVNAGDELIVKGGFNICSWLYVETQAGIVGWVSGNSRYTKLETPCNEVPEVDLASMQETTSSHAQSVAVTATSTPSPAQTAPTSEPAAVPPTATYVANAATNSESTATPTPQIEFYGTIVPEGKGCIAWGSYVGPDMYITATHRASREIIETL